VHVRRGLNAPHVRRLPRKRDDWLAYRELGVLEICRYYGGVTVNPGDPEGPWTRPNEAYGLKRLGRREWTMFGCFVAVGIALALWAFGAIP
jgi:hypothetical protein